MQGLLTPDGMMNIMKVVEDHIFKEFKPRKQTLMQERIDAYKRSDWQNYMQKIGQAQQEMMQLTGLRTQGAFKHLGYDSQQFQLMKGRTFSTPEQMKALQEYKATLPTGVANPRAQ
jgi:hypothetical protein